MKMLKTIKPILIFACLVGMMTLLLAATNEFTEKRIQKQEKAVELEKKQAILPEATQFQTIEISEEISDLFKAKDLNIRQISIGLDPNNKPLGYVFFSSHQGYGGEIIAATGFSLKGDIIKVKLSAPNETPGLGTKVLAPEFTEQFKQLNSQSLLSFSSQNTSQTVDGISGATISSTGALSSINQAIEAFQILSQQGGLIHE